MSNLIVTMDLSPSDVVDIAKIGHQRMPAEACGILLRVPHKGERIFEVPNRAIEANDEFVMSGKDILLVLEDYEGDVLDLAIWHTHPGGQLGPSKADMEQRLKPFPHLVITLYDRPQEAKATWF